MSQYIKDNLQYNNGDITTPEKLLLAELWAIGAPAFVREGERHITLTAEQNDDRVWASQCYRGEVGIDLEVYQAISRRGFFFEWESAACVSIIKGEDA